MPAVQLTRLKNQIDELSWQFTRPEEFQHSLHRLFDSYGNRTFRPGQKSIQAVISQPAYHVPVIVINQLELALNGWASENGVSALTLADVLWTDSTFEPRMLAAHLIGVISIEFSEEVLERLQRWALPSEERVFLDGLFSKGTATIRRLQPNLWLETISKWLSSPDDHDLRIGLIASIPLIEDRSFQNLPVIYKLLSHIVHATPKKFQNEITQVIVSLAKRSPVETLFFLRQMLGLNPSTELQRLIRKCMPSLPLEMQRNIRDTLQTLSKKK